MPAPALSASTSITSPSRQSKHKKPSHLLGKMFVALCLCMPLSSFAQLLILDPSGQLIGAAGVNVNGNLYNVSFVDGLCGDIFDGCDDQSDFDFQNEADAVAASETLMNFVFVDSIGRQFDSNPALTKTCEGTAGLCSVLTPYDLTSAAVFNAGFANNNVLEVDDSDGSSTYFVNTDYGADDETTFAVWNLVTNSDLPAVGSADLYVHLDASVGVSSNAGVVSQWLDQSGNDFVFSRNRADEAAGNDPMTVANVGNGQPAIEFDGNDILTSTADLQLFPTNSSALTIFAVFNTTNNDQQSFIATHNLDVSTGFENFEFGYDTGFSNGAGNFGLHRGAFEATIAPPGTIQNNELVLMSVEVLPTGTPPDNIKIRKNGGLLPDSNDATGWLAAGNYRTDLAPLDIGGRFDLSELALGAFHSGAIAEVIIYRGELSEGDRRNIENTLVAEYGLTLMISDGDGDGIEDADDNCPEDANVGQVDTDGDGQGDACDTDDDNDGVSDDDDNDPLDPFFCEDVEGDGCDDCTNGQDQFGPLPDNDTADDGLDTDGDEFCDAGDDDDDNDGVLDLLDTDPNDPDVCSDVDGDTCDDCAVGVDDMGPLDDFDPTNDGLDTDGDGLCDAGDPTPFDIDTDGDTVADEDDNCPTVPNTDQTDSNGDGFGDACVAPDVTVLPTVQLGIGVEIGSGSTVRPGTSIGDFSIIGEEVNVRRDAEIGIQVVILFGARIGPDSFIANGATIREGARLGRDVFVGESADVGAGSQIRNGASIGAGSQIGENVIIAAGVVIPPGTIIGDNSRIRQNVVLGLDVTIGADVTLSNGAQLGDDTFIDDGATVRSNSVLGARVSVGSDTLIRANASVGDDTSIGSDVLIRGSAAVGANVTIGDGATIRAGGVIPDGAVVPDNATAP